LTFDPFSNYAHHFLCVFNFFDDDFVTRLNFLLFSHLNSYLSFANYMFNFQGALPLTYY